MSKFRARRLTLLQYWTSRFVITLIIGLVCIGVIMFFWIQYSFNRHQVQAGHQFIDEVKRVVSSQQGRIKLGRPDLLPRFIAQQKMAANIPGNEVVTGEDAKHFMDVCFKASQRLHRMVEDLLEFNSFATGSIKVAKEQINMNLFLDEIIRQWAMMQEGTQVKLHAALPAQQLFAMTDASRLHQVFINLINNAKDALEGDRIAEGSITVTLYADNGAIGIDVFDTGYGIEVHEQPLVFESFYRGEGKQRKVRGIGLGLPLCRLIMSALGGAIVLKESSPGGTTFSLSLKSEN